MVMIQIELIALMLLQIVRFSASQCSSGLHIRSPTYSGKRLTGSLFRVFEKVGYNTCFHECMRRPICQSYNYRQTDFFCELNSGIASDEDVLDSNDNFDYTSIADLKQTFMNPCLNMAGCNPGTICVRNDNGTRSCIVEDPVSYRNYLEEQAALVTTEETTSTTVAMTAMASTEKPGETDLYTGSTTNINITKSADLTTEVTPSDQTAGQTELVTSTSESPDMTEVSSAASGNSTTNGY